MSRAGSAVPAGDLADDPAGGLADDRAGVFVDLSLLSLLRLAASVCRVHLSLVAAPILSGARLQRLLASPESNMAVGSDPAPRT
ncbi:MAG: hypothetical protein ACRD0Z_13560 [Acidimicrobiales bacterium]